MYLDAKPQIRYPIAAVLAALGFYLLKLTPTPEPFFVVMYILIVGIYAKELSYGILCAVAIYAAFKFLVKLPLPAALALIVLAILFGGVI